MTWTKDAEEVYKCYEEKNKPGLVNILGNRTRAQLQEICAIYEEKYGEPLHVRLSAEGTRLLGKITGSLTNFSKLLLYRVMPQDERDAGFLKVSPELILQQVYIFMHFKHSIVFPSLILK